jgi:multimeric flavodoxin WrbA/putative sterol carrier protein
MKKTLSIVSSAIPFIGLILINSLVASYQYFLPPLTIPVIIISSVVILNTLIRYKLKKTNCFMWGLTFVITIGLFMVLFLPEYKAIYLNNVIAWLYIGLFLAAFIPPIFGIDPFTFKYSKHTVPKVVADSKLFLVINLIINYIWAALFVAAFFTTIIHYSDNNVIQQILKNIIPIAIQLGIGLPLTIFLPKYLPQVLDIPLYFNNADEMFAAMPLGLNKKRAKGIDTIVQFCLSGDDGLDGYLTIKDQKCTFTKGIHPKPNTTIKADAKLWLGISNKEIDGEEASINKKYSVEGDLTIFKYFLGLFSKSKKYDKEYDDSEFELDFISGYKKQFDYGTLPSLSIKKILVIDGGPRNDHYSKSTYIANKFLEGAKSAGANVEYIKLKNLKINDCLGCYTCWTKTPGVCIHKDDMPEILNKMRHANLIVFISPLYIFSVTGKMKSFLDRIIPNMKPYMADTPETTQHPARYKQDNNNGFVVFSAAGFPEVNNNFDGLAAIFRNMSDHIEKMSLLGEFYLPAAEIMVHGLFSDRRASVEKACYDAGVQVVKEGKINTSHMYKVRKPWVSKNTFQRQANTFWKSLDGKKAYIGNVKKL